MDLPKQNIAKRIGEKGLTILKSIVENQLGWNLRINHLEDDYGIDAYIDLINEKQQVTGKSIAIQVKTGKSYFARKNKVGWIYRDKISHLNYYLNHDLPVIIVLVNDEIEKAYWCLCDANKTDLAGNEWTITIPFTQVLQKKSIKQLIKYVSPIKDYVSQLEHFWKENSFLASRDRITFLISKMEIESNDFIPILNGIKRLAVNENLILSLKEKIDILIDGYDNNNQELYEIVEVQHWINVFLKNVEGFAYFLIKNQNAQFLRVIQLFKVEYALSDVVIINGLKKKKLFVDPSKSKHLLDILFNDLNTFCDKHSIPEDVNKEITTNIVEFLFGKILTNNSGQNKM